MNLLKNKLASKLMLVAAMILGSGTLFAANKIYLGNLQPIQTYDEVRLPVMFDCDAEAVGVQFDVVLPKSLELKDIEFNTERQSDHMPEWGIKNKVPTFLVFSPSFDSFVGSNGVIAYLHVKVTDGALKVPSTSPIKLENIKISGANGILVQGASDEKMISIGEVSKIMASLSSNVVNPNGKLTVNVGLNNTVIAQGMQLDVELPAGFAFVCSANGRVQVTNGPRLTKGTTVQGKPKGNKVTFVLYNLKNSIIDSDDFGPGEDLFSFDVTAPAEFAGKDNIVISNVVISLPGSEGIESAGEGLTLEIVNGSEAKATAEAKVAELEKNLTAALADIAKNYPDVKEQFKGEEITAKIDALKKAIAAAYADLSLSDPEKYKEVMAPAEEIATAIAALVPAAKAEVDRVATNKAANKADNDKIAAFETKLTETLAEVAKTYPDYDVTADKAAAEKVIADAKKAAEDNLKAVEKEGTYASTLSEESIQTAIDAIAKNAKADADKKAEAAEAARVAANKAAYDKDVAAIAPYEAQLAVALEAVKGNAAYDVTADKATAEKAIADAKKAAADNLKAVEKEGVYKSTLDIAPIVSAIAAISKNADAATAEAARVAANKAAYDKDLATIAALETKLAEAVAAVAADYPDYDAAADKAAAEKAIADAKKAAADNLKAVEKKGNYASTLDAAAVEATIAAIAENAKADADKKAEEALKAANDAAKAKADAKVAELNKALADAVAKIKETCPLVAEMFDGEAEKASIASLENAISAAYEAKTIAAEYDNVIAPAATINDAIATLVKEAEAAQAAAVAEAARVEANDKAYKAEVAQIDVLVKELEDEIAKFDPEWTNLQYETQLNVRNYIDGLSTKVENEKNRVADEGNYNNQLKASDLSMARGLISEYVQKVQTSGIDSIVADENLGNVRIYTIDGVQHNRLVPGVNIIVKEDGTTSKVYVK